MKNLTLILFTFFFNSIFCFSQDKQDINNNLFGFCTSNSFTYVNTIDSSFLNKVNRINPQVLRFPGGTIGNFYHPRKSGYGFQVSDVDKWYSGRFSHRVRTLKNAAVTRGHTQNYLEDFIRLCKDVNAKVILNANILTGDLDDIIYLINRFMNEDIEVLGVELGSELSNRAYKKKISSVNDYIKIAKKYATNIKYHFPNMKIGVVASPIRDNTPFRLRYWNKHLSKEDFYDAIVHHSYHKVVDGVADAGVMISEKKVYENKYQIFNTYRDRIILEMEFGFLARILEYQQIYGDKEIWITEWNLQMTKTTGNTLLQSLFVAHYLLNIISDNNLQDIKLATYHNLAGRDLSGSIFQGDKKGLITHSTYIPFSMLSLLFEKDIVKVSKENIDKETYIFYCENKEGDVQMIYILNWSDKEIHFPLLEEWGTYSCQSFYSQNLYDTPDVNGLFGKQRPLLDQEMRNIDINRYSFSCFYQD